MAALTLYRDANRPDTAQETAANPSKRPPASAYETGNPLLPLYASKGAFKN